MDRAKVELLDPDSVGRVTAAAGVRQPLHRHADARIVLFVGGEMHEEAFEGSARFVRGDFVFRPSHFAHADIPGAEGAAFVRLHPSAQAVRRWMKRNGWRAGRGHVDLDQPLHADDLLDHAESAPYAQITPTTEIQRAAALLAQDHAPSVQDAAAMLCMAPYELTRRFSAAFAMTPCVYRRGAQLQRAIQMLSEDSASLAQVAHGAGFHDQSHLTVALRRETRLTPKALRDSSK